MHANNSNPELETSAELARRAHAADARLDELPAALPKLGAELRQPRRTGKILIVDDNPVNIALLEGILGQQYELQSTTDSRAAIALAERQRPDIILLDIVMPHLDGYEVCRSIRAHEQLRQTKVIMLSARSSPGERVAGYAAGANDYLAKPYEAHELIAKLQVYLQLKTSDDVVRARDIGRAEVASSLLHNAGNALTSVVVSASRLSTLFNELNLSDFSALAQLVNEHDEDLPAFIQQDPRGKMLPLFLKEFADHVERTQVTIHEELVSLGKRVEYVRNVLQMQRTHASKVQSDDCFSLRDVIEEVIQLAAPYLEHAQMAIVFGRCDDLTITTDRNKMLQILLNIVRNAAEAVAGAATRAPQLHISSQETEAGMISITISDNGPGIAAEHLAQIFRYGFTTKSSGNGLGLHSSYILANDLGGILRVQSAGSGHGASFELLLPKTVATVG